MSVLQAAEASEGRTAVGSGGIASRWRRNRDYVASLTARNLLRPYLAEAGLWSYAGSYGTTIGVTDPDVPTSWHWGWEAPTSELRGHILGHWLSAASRLGADSPELAGRARHVVSELARCQEANGGEWLAPFPVTFLDRVVSGRPVWAPQYTLHKLLMGLLDMYRNAGDETALRITLGLARWFERWTATMSRDRLDDVLDYETGGMLEVWADLYGITGDPQHLELLRRYDRPRFFDRLLAGEDVLTNKHANTQLAEVLGAARAYEVTGEERWRRIVEEFWRLAVVDRGVYCTGGSSSGEVWQPQHQQSARLGDVQEHCVVLGMMRLADTLYRWTGESTYADHWERNLVNGILAQQHPETGMVSYFLPLAAGSTKRWGRPTEDFWCCHGTLMQAHALVPSMALHRTGGGLRVSQYVPSITRWTSWDSAAAGDEREEATPSGLTVAISTDAVSGPTTGDGGGWHGLETIQRVDLPAAPVRRPREVVHRVEVRSDTPRSFTLELRIPDWAVGDVGVTVDGAPVPHEVDGAYVRIERVWSDAVVEIRLERELTWVPLPDAPDTGAFLDGPVVLAGLVQTERTLRVSGEPTSVLTPDRERQHSAWNLGTYRVTGQPEGFRFIPLNEVRDETYTVYFPVVAEAPA